jgi:hypothetical protein
MNLIRNVFLKRRLGFDVSYNNQNINQTAIPLSTSTGYGSAFY